METLPAKQQKDALSALLRQDAIKARFDEVLGKKAPGFMSSIISAVNGNPALKKAEPMSVISSAAVAAALDLPINQNLGFAYLVPYSGKATFQMGYKGYIQLAMRTGQYKTINVTPVHEGELIENNPFTGDMKFDVNARTSEKIIGYVAYFRLLNGFEKYLFMTAEETRAHGKRYSQSFSNSSSRWQSDFDAMSMKTVLKLLLSKYGILSIEMQTSILADQAIVKETGEYEYPDNFGDVIEGEEVHNGNEALKKKLKGPVEPEPDPKEYPQEVPEPESKEERFECPRGGYTVASLCLECEHLEDKSGRCPAAPVE